jgi:hypothetical protein
MPAQGSSSLESPIEGLLATPTSRLPYQNNVLLRSYVLERPQGNLIVYNSPGVSESADAITALGAPARLLINHGHESIYGPPAIDVPVWVHSDDRAEIAGSLDVSGTFDERTMIDADLEVIPTPGHTVGTTSFLWNNGQWKAVVLSPQLRDDYLASLALVRDLDFDVLVPWGTTEGDPSFGLVADDREKRDRIDAIIERVRAGGDR